MTQGTVIAQVRAYLVGRWRARAGLEGVQVNYWEPVSPEDVVSESVFFKADAEGAVQVQGINPLPVKLREGWTLTVVAQVLPRDSGDDQETVEVRLADLAGEVLDQVAADPHCSGLSVPGWARATVLPEGWRWKAGLLGSAGGYGARVELDLHVDAERT